MIVIKLLGGLGNQLFQYCFGRSLALRTHNALSFDTRLLDDNRPGTHAVNRKYSLDLFEAKVAFAPISNVIWYSADGLPRPIRGLLRATGITNQSRQRVETKFGFDEAIWNAKGSGYYSGLWQSVRYFADAEPQIRQDLQFRNSIQPESVEVKKQIQLENSVCLHVRRTDYLTHVAGSSSLGFVGLDYYRSAIYQLEGLTESPRYFIFSDDLDWCRAEFSFLPNAIFVGDEHAGYKDGGHLQLMSLCRNFIIPNSTFSWWAAWLSTTPEKLIMLPEPWFSDPAINASGLYPTSWLRIPVR